MGKIRIGVSACLLGEEVRHDGRHKRDPNITEALSQEFELVPVCPEVGLGLGVPREPMHLEGDLHQPRLVTNSTRIDLTDRMRTWCTECVRSLEKESLCGFIFKSKSPSCGMSNVEIVSVRDQDGATAPGGFARAFMEYFPGVPVVDEVLLQDPVLRVDFAERASALSRG